MITKICENCGKEFQVIPSRNETARYCCRKCADEARKGIPNVQCSICGKWFHMKSYRLNRYSRRLGIFCSRECLNKGKEIGYCGAGNHQFGLKGPQNSSFKGEEIIVHNHKVDDIMVYCPNHPFANKTGRVKKHRLIVEENYSLFPEKYFVEIDGKSYLKPSTDVHHLDFDHNNNDISNLIPCTRKEHRQYHKSIIVERDNLGRIIKTAVIKQGELLEQPNGLTSSQATEEHKSM